MGGVGFDEPQQPLALDRRTRKQVGHLPAGQEVHVIEVAVHLGPGRPGQDRPDAEAHEVAAERARQPMHGRENEMRFDRERIGGRLHEVVAGDPLDLAAELPTLAERHVFDHGIANQDVEVPVRVGDVLSVVEPQFQAVEAPRVAARLTVVRDVEQDEVLGHEVPRHGFPEVARPAEIANALGLQVRTAIPQDPAPLSPKMCRQGMNETNPSRHDIVLLSRHRGVGIPLTIPTCLRKRDDHLPRWETKAWSRVGPR